MAVVIDYLVFEADGIFLALPFQGRTVRDFVAEFAAHLLLERNSGYFRLRLVEKHAPLDQVFQTTIAARGNAPLEFQFEIAEGGEGDQILVDTRVRPCFQATVLNSPRIAGP